MTDKLQAVQSLISELRIELSLLGLSGRRDHADINIDNIDSIISEISSNCNSIAKEKLKELEED